MTLEAIKNVVKALAILSVVVGGYGSILCLPFAFTNSLSLVTTAGIYFVAGGVMIAGGLVTLSVMLQQEK